MKTPLKSTGCIDTLKKSKKSQMKPKFRVCFVCNKRKLTDFHHLKPRSEGGKDESRNFMVVCYDCHNIIEGKEWSEIMEIKKQFVKDVKPSPTIIPNVVLHDGEKLRWDEKIGCWKVWGTDKYGVYAVTLHGEEVERTYIYV